MKLTVTLNTADSEYNDIEVEVPATVTTIDQVLAAAIAQTDESIDEVTSFVIVGVVE